jgi:ribosome-associated translation inhibitor RaiA
MSDENETIPVDISPEKEAAPDDLSVVVLDEDEPAPIAAENDEKDPYKAIEKLKKKLKKEKEARQEAERKAQEASFQVQRANYEVEDTQMHLVNNAIETIKRDNEILTANYADSMRNGDFEGAARIQLLMADNEANLKKLETGRIGMEEKLRNKPPAPPQQVLKPKEQIDQIIGQVSKPSAQWLRANRDHFQDPADITDMFGAHESAIKRGIDPDTPEYFSFIEKRLGINSDNQGESPMSSASKPVQRQAAPPPSAPVNRDGGRTNIAHLTKAQAEAAKSFGMTEKEYAMHVIALQKEGRLSH